MAGMIKVFTKILTNILTALYEYRVPDPNGVKLRKRH